MRIAHITFSAAVAASAAGQCGMTTYVGVNQGCHFAPQAIVSTNGGMAPYTIQVERRNAITLAWSTLFTVSNDADGFLSMPGNLYDWDNTDRARATVTDANSCVATWTESLGPYVHFTPAPAISIDCTAGTASLDLGLMQVCQGGVNQFSIDGGAPSNFSSSWNWVGAGIYRYTGTLTPGAHSLVLLDLMCSGAPGSPTYCYEPPSLSFTIPFITAGDCGVNFNLRAALAGALPSGTLMNDDLRAGGLIPSSEPYSAMGYTYVGASPGASMDPALLAVTGGDAIVDWVVVELRSAANPATVLHSRPALLQRDGDVVGLNGSSYINAPLSAGNYHVALRHRNHLGVMTGTARSLSLNPTSVTVDFRSSGTATYGSAARTAVGSVQCLWPGDAASDGTIRYVGNGNDRDPILVAIGGSTPTNVVSNVYSPLDVNMDGQIRYVGNGNDRDYILTTVGGSTPNNTRMQQLP